MKAKAARVSRSKRPARANARAKAVAVSPEDLLPPSRPRNQVLPVAIAISLLVHAAVLLVRFVPPLAKPRESKTQPLEVVLVNAKSPQKPVKADALAQADLAGGGNTEQERRAKTNLPVLSDSTTSELSVAQQRVRQLESEMQRLATRLKSDHRVDRAPERAKVPQERSEGREQVASTARSDEIARLEAQIARQMDRYQKLPKRKFIGARAEGVVYAQYVDEWRQKIERIGTRYFPQEAKRQGIYGSLLITVSVRADGSVEQVEIERSSGYPVLDDAARRIVQLASPFAPFPPAIRREYDILSITRNWSFTRADGLVSE
jgi:protein TonB